MIFADAANRAATNENQWYVTISRGRKRALVFTSDKEELRANVQRAGDRELALELKPKRSEAVTVDWSEWRRRAIDAAERFRRHQAVTGRVQQQDQRRRIAV